MVTKKTHIGLLRLRRHRAEQSQACGAAVRIAVIKVPPDIGAARRPAMAVKNPGNAALFRHSRAVDRLTRQ
jgi:hypothetical protein